MGKKPAEIERDIAEKRSQISRRVEELRARARQDAGWARSEARTRAGNAVDEAKGALKVDSVKQAVRERTVSSLALALGAGVALGIASEGVALRPRRRGTRAYQDDGRRPDPGDSRDGGESLMASLLGPAAGTAQRELETLVRGSLAAVREETVSAVREVMGGSRRGTDAAAEAGTSLD